MFNQSAALETVKSWQSVFGSDCIKLVLMSLARNGTSLVQVAVMPRALRGSPKG